MSNIWHKLPEQPENGRDVIEKWHHLGIHYTHFVAKNGIAEDNPFTDAWCYLDDLLALETELERTRRALETIQEFVTKLYLNGNITDEQLERYKKMLIRALEQKDNGDNK